MPRVLIAEDSPTQAKELELVLASEGYEVVHAPDGETALEQLEAGRFDLVLSDILMPGINGYELCRSIKENPVHRQIPVILLTCLSDALDIVRGLECGSDNFITKPFEPQRLLARIERILAAQGTKDDDPSIAGLEIDFKGSRFTINARRGQMLDFLMSTFEEFAQAKQRELETELEAESRRREELGALTEELKEMNARLTKLASVDPLTELLNRRGLDRVLTIEMNRSQRSGSDVVAALADLDDFKRVNDRLGHAVGDVVLTEVAKRLQSSLRPSDRVGRVGGDEFLILLPDTRLAEAQRVVDRVRLAVGESPLMVFTDQIRITASIGTVMLPYETCSIEEVLSLTRQGLRDAKQAGGNRVSLAGRGGGGNGDHAQRQADIAAELRQPSSFRAVSQPIYRLVDKELVGYELLSRGPRGAFEMPLDFFRVCLESNILTMVDLQCLKICIAASGELEPAGRMHVNLFPSTLLDTPPERLIPLLTATEGTVFCVEISEQQFISDPACLQDQVAAFREGGVLVAMDDVGFGRSSLEALLMLEPDLVKIDPKYVTGVSTDDGKSRSLLRLIKVVESLDAELVAEGIESTADFEVLRDMGVGYGQGFLWGRPS